MKRGVVLGIVVLWAVAVVSAEAAVICQKKSGAMFVRTNCNKKETPVDLSGFGAIGPKGDKGDKGDTGSAGVPGAAIAYAHINADGTVDAAHSKNVTSANVSLVTGGLVPVFCFHGLPFTFQNAVAVVDWNGVGTSGNFAQVGLGDPAGDCLTQTDLVVVTETSSVVAAQAFMVIFN